MKGMMMMKGERVRGCLCSSPCHVVVVIPEEQSMRVPSLPFSMTWCLGNEAVCVWLKTVTRRLPTITGQQ